MSSTAGNVLGVRGRNEERRNHNKKLKKRDKEKTRERWLVCRVHAKKIGHSLFGDEAYGGAGGSAVSAVGRGKSLRYACHTKHRRSKAISTSCLIPE
jgi:hypothetical protein